MPVRRKFTNPSQALKLMHTFRLLNCHDAADLAARHAQAFDTPWSAGSFATELAKPTTRAVAYLDADDEIVGFILVQHVGDSAEILTLATLPSARQRGIATALLWEVEGQLTARGVQTLILDVAADNIPAIALYEKFDYVRDGRRKNYYPRKGKPSVDAILMRRDLTGLP